MSWEKAAKWYDDLVGVEGHYYHRAIVIPGVLRLLSIEQPAAASLLDLGCGQGVLARALPTGVAYCGVDIAKGLISAAQKGASNRRFIVADASKKLPFEEGAFTHATIALALQNMADPEAVLANAGRHLKSDGRLVIVLNHPYYRIPRQSNWFVDVENKVQYRRIAAYMSSMEIPLQMNPGKGEKSAVTYSYHYPLCRIVAALNRSGMAIVALEEWCSDKKSTGAAARMENRARREIPLFMALVANKY